MNILRHSILEIVLLAICVFLYFQSDVFLTRDNLLLVLRNSCEIGIIAFGMTMVIIAGEIDLSVGSAVAFAGCLTACLIEHGWPAWAAVATALALGAAIGGFTGFVRTKFNVPSFITSLALLTALRGAAFKLTGGYALTNLPTGFAYLGSGYLVGIPFPVILLALVFTAVHFVMNFTTFGRSVYAVGGNAEAARLCGISVGRVRVGVLAITGLLAALSGVVLTARISSGSPEVAQGWELDVIAAVIVGGTSLSGGAGRVWGTLVGVLFMAVIVNGMRLMDVHEDGQLIARGVIVLLAVLLSRMQQER
ncbi:MAG TPA: ABC transporter permease [Phycisphaerae bacterium]|nr:ABC transporter permease [Phycisphaerae bacterium]